MSGKKIGILTGGGDVPGLNAVIKSVVYRATSDGHEVTGIRLGWKGLTDLNFDDPGERKALCSSTHAREHPHHRPHGRHVPAHQPDKPVQDEKAARLS